MARLEAKSKVLYYPTPLEIMTLIASNIEANGTGSILDPCAGTGKQVAYLGHQLGLTTYGNELHPKRFAEAEARLDHCLNGAREFLCIDGKFSVIFNNPPYDETMTGERMEVTHIKADLDLLAAGGLGIWVVPETIIDISLCYLLVGELRQVKIRRFPEPEYQKFKQCVIFGLKREAPDQQSLKRARELVQLIQRGLPTLQAGEFQYQFVSSKDQISRFEQQFLDADQVLQEVADNGVHRSDGWQTLMGANGNRLDDFQPILRLTSGHAAMVIAAGIVDGTEVEIDDQPYLIKGSTRKLVKVTQQSEAVENGTQKTIREREQLVQTITAFNLTNGRLLEFNSYDDHDSFSKFLLDHQQTLVDTIDQKYPPLFEPDRDMPHWMARLNRVRAPGVLPGQKVARGLLPAQQIRAAALATKLQTDKAVVLVGECGTGKTAMSQAIAALLGNGAWKLVVVAPANVTHKCKREAQKVLANFGVKVHIIGQKRKQPDGKGKMRTISKPVLDVIRAMEEPNPAILVMSYQTAKNGARWEHAVAKIRKPLRYSIEVEEIEPLDSHPFERVVTKEQTLIQVDEVLCCPDCGSPVIAEHGPLKVVAELGDQKRHCDECDTPLWQYVSFKYGGRIAIADFLNRHYSGRYNLILDEAHNVKGADTDAGYAATDLISAACKVVAMTGTLYSGKASSIFHLLYRLFPHFRALYGYNEVLRFIEHHGLQETITTVKPGKQWSSAYGYKRENVRVKELPGVSPGMVTLLLNNTAFIKLADIGLDMPEYSEQRLPIPLDPRLQTGLQDLEEIYKVAVDLAQKKQPGLLSSWLYASLGWVDNPISEELSERNEVGEVVATHPITGILSSNDELLAEPLAKDDVLISLIESHLSVGRGVGVYFAQVNRRDWMGRIHKLLKQQGIYSEILRQNTCKPEDREAWYRGLVQRCRAQGQEPVLLSNGNLVKEGLDLVELPTLIETGIEFKINDLRQRDRRAWRLIQEKPCNVIFLYYEGEDSMQETALRLVATKLKAALTVDGDLSEGLASMSVDNTDLMEALMKAVSKGRTNTIEWSGMQVAQIEPTEDMLLDATMPDIIIPDSALEVPDEWQELPLFGNAISMQKTMVAVPRKQRKKGSKGFDYVEVDKGVVQLSLI